MAKKKAAVRHAQKREERHGPARDSEGGWRNVQHALLIGAALLMVLALAYVFMPKGQPAPQPAAPQQLPSQPLPENPPAAVAPEKPGIVDAKIRDGGYAFIIARNPKTTNVTGVRVDGTGKDYSIAPGNGSGEEAILVDEPDITCQNFANGTVVVLINYTINGTVYFEEVVVEFGGCEEPPSSPPPVQCALEGQSCIEQECCAGYDCAGDRLCHAYPGCAYIGDSCQNLECCGGLVCDNSTKICQMLEGCSQAGQTCEDDGWCCTGLRCDYRVHVCKSVPSCALVDQPCQTYDDCCPLNPPLVCRDLTCRHCSAKGGICTQDSDCCMHTPQMACINKACELHECVQNGGACEEDTDCCAKSCVFGVCSQG